MTRTGLSQPHREYSGVLSDVANELLPDRRDPFASDQGLRAPVECIGCVQLSEEIECFGSTPSWAALAVDSRR